MLENKRIYSLQHVANYYGDNQDLQLPEKFLLYKHHDSLLGKRVLDLGCGGGRTTKHLLESAGEYVGVDYSVAMIKVCKNRFPGVSFMVGDARNLHQFVDAYFDFVLFSFNGIDYMSHHDRIEALTEIARVLRPGGIFMFSTHNRKFRRMEAEPRFTLSSNPFTVLKRAVRYAQGKINRAKLKGKEVDLDEYAMINDSAFNFSLLTYYIDPLSQVRQLEAAGFSILDIVDVRGNALGSHDVGSDSPWIYFVCKTALPCNSPQKN